MGVNARGLALAKTFQSQPNSMVSYVCDVDSRASAKCMRELESLGNSQAKADKDFRRILEKKDLDVLAVAAPAHWHAPAAILASNAGKHIYLEKPCSHNPREGELLLEAVAKSGIQIQMGNQRRSWPNVVAAINELHKGIIGKPYYDKTWYANSRPSIGKGKKTEVPSWLDFELWQGPAPRRDFQDNLIHYNWHWFWHWGTAESANNGTHMLDIARWGLQVDYPTRVTSMGGRYHFSDDWETPDTQLITIEFGDKGLITWEGRSCNARLVDGSSVGVIFYGSDGSMQINGDNGYLVYDQKNRIVKEVKNTIKVDVSSLTNLSQELDSFHLQNFFDAIRKGARLNSDIEGGHKSTLLAQLGNIAQRTGAILETDPASGRIRNNPEAAKLWSRDYEKGWEPVV